MFHIRDNFYVGRRADGSVRIVKFKGGKAPKHTPVIDKPVHGAVFDILLGPHEWASVIATVSHEGETAGKYLEALKFHHGPMQP